jgi:hypothetical protein
LLSPIFHALVAGCIWCVVVYSVFFDHKKRKSPEAHRRERQYRQAEKKAQRYAAKPPLFRVIDQEKRLPPGQSLPESFLGRPQQHTSA